MPSRWDRQPGRIEGDRAGDLVGAMNRSRPRGFTVIHNGSEMNDEPTTVDDGWDAFPSPPSV